MTNKEQLQQQHNYEICNHCGLSESESTEQAASSCTTVTEKAMGEFTEWKDRKYAYNANNKVWHDDYDNTYTTTQLLTLYMQQDSKLI